MIDVMGRNLMGSATKKFTRLYRFFNTHVILYIHDTALSSFNI